jgi:hypothetical protein
MHCGGLLPPVRDVPFIAVAYDYITRANRKFSEGRTIHFPKVTIYSFYFDALRRSEVLFSWEGYFSILRFSLDIFLLESHFI